MVRHTSCASYNRGKPLSSQNKAKFVRAPINMLVTHVRLGCKLRSESIGRAHAACLQKHVRRGPSCWTG